MFSFCVSWNIESHTGLEQYEGEQIMTYFLFLGELFNGVNVTFFSHFIHSCTDLKNASLTSADFVK